MEVIKKSATMFFHLLIFKRSVTNKTHAVGFPIFLTTVSQYT